MLGQGLVIARSPLPLTPAPSGGGTSCPASFSTVALMPGMARPAWWVAGEVLAGQGPDRDAPSTASEAFDLVAGAFDAFAGVRHADLGFGGRRIGAQAGAAR